MCTSSKENAVGKLVELGVLRLVVVVDWGNFVGTTSGLEGEDSEETGATWWQ